MNNPIVPPATSFPPESSNKASGGGEQHLYKFGNGYGASVVRSHYSYGGDRGLYELAVLNPSGGIDTSTPVTDNVEGWLDDNDLERLLEQISELPAGGSNE